MTATYVRTYVRLVSRTCHRHPADASKAAEDGTQTRASKPGALFRKIPEEDCTKHTLKNTHTCMHDDGHMTRTHIEPHPVTQQHTAVLKWKQGRQMVTMLPPFQTCDTPRDFKSATCRRETLCMRTCRSRRSHGCEGHITQTYIEKKKKTESMTNFHKKQENKTETARQCPNDCRPGLQ